MIKKIKGGYRVVSQKTGRNLGTYKGKEAHARALSRLRAVEYFKRHPRKKK